MSSWRLTTARFPVRTAMGETQTIATGRPLIKELSRILPSRTRQRRVAIAMRILSNSRNRVSMSPFCRIVSSWTGEELRVNRLRSQSTRPWETIVWDVTAAVVSVMSADPTRWTGGSFGVTTL